jgi:UTP--glucose-1-phosphate uridylyltransferase
LTIPMMQDLRRVVIPSAGLGTRFLPLTRVVPKELLPLGDWPLIHHAVLEAERAGFSEVIIVISPGKRAIRSYFEGDEALERALQSRGEIQALERVRAARALCARMRVQFVEKETQGPGEAVLLAYRFTGDENLGVLFPDDVIPSVHPWHDLQKLRDATGMGTLSVRTFPAQEAGRYGVAACTREDGKLRIRQLIEKPAPGAIVSSYRIFGRYIVTAPILAALQSGLRRLQGELQLTDAYASCLSRSEGIFAAEFTGEAFDCGTPSEYVRSIARYAASGAQSAAAAGVS